MSSPLTKADPPARACRALAALAVGPADRDRKQEQENDGRQLTLILNFSNPEPT
jgi:hypothetical protein